MAGYQVFREEDAPYFVTSTTVAWAHVFTSEPYFHILIDALAYCRKQKGLRIYGYVLMTNHFHLIGQTDEPGALSSVMRDLKRHTAREIVRRFREDNQQALLHFFQETSLRRAGNTEAKVWQDGFHPILLPNQDWFLQKLDYLEANPVRKGYVDQPEHWRFSSARNRLLGDHDVLEIDYLES
jgi:REP-associated tyrosine transposase